MTSAAENPGDGVVSLADLLSACSAAVQRAQATADLGTSGMAPEYAGDEVLRTFAVPHFTVRELQVTVYGRPLDVVRSDDRSAVDLLVDLRVPAEGRDGPEAGISAFTMTLANDPHGPRPPVRR
ncbi:hypothetical protein ACIBCM_03880 [Streptomyces sp. NPDC051018]|uniref:hypothetical protein n=1 Tax=Streptomyces sp. NPDC051018 TaxID=3365639 RepID=UPI0037A527DE